MSVRGSAAGIAFGALWIGAAGAAASTVELGAGQAGAPQHVQVGDELVLRLYSNPSTGTHWRIDASTAGAVLETLAAGRLLDPPPRPVVGSGGRYEWRFRAIAPGEATLRLQRIEARAVPAPSAPVRVFTVVVAAPAAP
ncbi:MAG TPA: protease inhibitor I42 family protein [Dokdonella sp.]|uniref:protease inhibitor I42 family protein n=1 Tax=Dokdonella sp. TaxID=2291710 RepID=UPI002CC2AA68|nr:protease inhibitor I42 family protein [Dokdonella sp.]HUD42731.1 protease inhibitor I42 family protein [Dokdonella sp.]